MQQLPPPSGLPQSTLGFAQETSLDALLLQRQLLAQQLDVLRAQQNAARSQTRNTDRSVQNTAREQLAQLNPEVARAQSQLGQVDALLRSKLRTVPSSVLPPQRDNSFPAEAVAGVSVVFTLAVLMPISIAFARRLWRRTTTPKAQEDVVSPRLDRLEHAVDAVAIEVERISEGQRFVTKVMTERPAVVRPSSAPDAADSSALGEAKPFLALGAGPMEPIPVAQRQAVRQSITPH
jgi:hypothetical protein